MSRASRKARKRSTRQSDRRGLLVAALVVGVIALGFASLSDPPPRPEPREPPPPPIGRVKVEILNSGGVSGMARRATEIARDGGFDVVDFGNANASDEGRPSAVLDRVGRPDVAGDVAELLGIDNVLSEPDPNLYVDVSVYVGSDWVDPGARPAPERGAPARAWWDPRGWIGR